MNPFTKHLIWLDKLPDSAGQGAWALLKRILGRVVSLTYREKGTWGLWCALLLGLLSTELTSTTCNCCKLQDAYLRDRQILLPDSGRALDLQVWNQEFLLCAQFPLPVVMWVSWCLALLSSGPSERATVESLGEAVLAPDSLTVQHTQFWAGKLGHRILTTLCILIWYLVSITALVFVVFLLF